MKKTTCLKSKPAGYRNLSAVGLTALLASTAPLRAAPAPATYNPAFVENLLHRLESAESEIRDLKSKPAAPATVVEMPAAPVPESFPQLQFHGFGDVTYHANDVKGDHNTFTLGQFDVFVTSQLSKKVGVLSETVIEAGGEENHFGIEIERLLLQVHLNDYFNMDIGRYHTSVGYYNTAYHHGTWFQTAVGRPAMLDFEDGGGIIPAHNVGVSFYGEVPSGKLNLRYVFEVGNGRAYQAPGTGDNLVLNVQDDNDYKSFNLAFTARPDFLPGVQVGAGIYHDTVTSVIGSPRIDETMLHGHTVYKNAAWEFLSEGYLIYHDVKGMGTHWTPAGFVQVARKFGDFTPYARFSYLNTSMNNPVYAFIGDSGHHYGPGIGLRWDFSSLAAFKAQFDRMWDTGTRGANEITLQATFTF